MRSRIRQKMPVEGACLICPKPATGFDYGVMTCGGCYTFFKRTSATTKDKVIHKCRNRRRRHRVVRRCRACRLKKCIQVGMSRTGNSNSVDKETIKFVNTWDTSYFSQLNNTNPAISSIFFVAFAAKMAFEYDFEKSSSVLEETLTPFSETAGCSLSTTTLNESRSDTISRIKIFASILWEKDPASLSHAFCQPDRFYLAGWKLFVAFLIVHEPVKADRYRSVYEASVGIKIGCNKSVRQPSFSNETCIDDLCDLISGLSLDQAGRHLLIAVILCEPEPGRQELDDLFAHRLARFHRDCLDALLECLKRDCCDSFHLAGMTERLGRFFGILPMVHDLIAGLPHRSVQDRTIS